MQIEGMSLDQQECPNIYLVGFMGVGKSVIGRRLAERLSMRFIDSDRAIEKKAGQSIAEIFRNEGEASFRRKESDFVKTGHPKVGVVVSCGGGLVIQEGMSELLKNLGVVICLFASPETIIERTSRNNKRPLLNVEDPEAKVLELLAEREPHYLAAGTCISTDERPIQDVVEHICRIYKKQINKR